MSNYNSASRNRTKKHSFQSDIAQLMESLGFDEALPETLDTLEDILINYVVDIYNEALRSSELHGRTKVKFDDIKFCVRHDVDKLHRMDEISRNLKIIAQNKKAFESKGKQVKNLKTFEDSDGEPSTKNSSRKGKKYKKKNKKLDDLNEEPKKKRKYVKKAQREKEAREREEAERKRKERAESGLQSDEDDDDDEDDDQNF